MVAPQPTDDKAPRDTPFKQQRLKAWQPILTPNWVIGVFAGVGIIFVVIGIIVLIIASGVVEYTQRYDRVCGTAPTCQVTIQVEKEMKSPVYFYYQLENVYQNHRRYVQSRSDAQLRGDKSPSLDTCDPRKTSEAPSKQGRDLYPCGLIATSFFNDVITAKVGTSADALTGASWSSERIIWESDRKKFKFEQSLLDAGTDLTLRDTASGAQTEVKIFRVDNPDFIVWMRTAGLPKFRKLYRIKDDGQPIPAGTTMTFDIANNFNVAKFDGTKSIVMSTTSGLGGKNLFLGWAYVLVGALCILAACAFAVKHVYSPRKLGDLTDWDNEVVGADR